MDLLTNYRSRSVPPTLEPTAIPLDVSPFETSTLEPCHRRPPPWTRRLHCYGNQSRGVPWAPEKHFLPQVPGPPRASRRPLLSPASQAEPLPVGKHDDTNPNIVYDRYWTFKMNSGTKFAYKAHYISRLVLGMNCPSALQGNDSIWAISAGRFRDGDGYD